MKDNKLVMVDNGAKRFTVVLDNEAQECEHPNIEFYDDEYDEDGKRISKHHWYCPDCGHLQVG